MKISRRRVHAIVRKEFREYRHNGNIIYTMAILPVIFLIQPLIQAFAAPSASSAALRHEHSLLYLLAIPLLVPAGVAAYAIVGERLQGALEPMLATPVRRTELLLGKALAAVAPSVVVAYTVYALFVAVIELFAGSRIAEPAMARRARRWQAARESRDGQRRCGAGEPHHRDCRYPRRCCRGEDRVRRSRARP